MFDPALITKCADPALKPAIIDIAEAGSGNPLSVTVKSGDRLILVPVARTSEEAMAIVSKYVGHAVVMSWSYAIPRRDRCERSLRAKGRPR